MNDDISLASSYYEIIENLSVIWEETSQDLRSIVTSHSIVTNPKHRRRLSCGPISYQPSSPRSVEGTRRTIKNNLRKSPLLKKNVLSLSPRPKKNVSLPSPAPSISEAEETEENNENGRESVLVTSLRTGQLIALPLQDDEYTFESCTTGSDMQSVESIEEYLSDDGEEQSKPISRRNAREEPTEDENIFEIVDELKEELLMIKHARDEAMKALYLHESSSPPNKTQRKTVSRSEEFLSRLSTTTRLPHFGNTDSSSLPDMPPSAKEPSLKTVPTPSATAADASLPSLPSAEVSSNLIDSNLPENDSKDDSPAIAITDTVHHAPLPEVPTMADSSTQQVIIDATNTSSGPRTFLSGEEDVKTDLTLKTASQEPKSETTESLPTASKIPSESNADTRDSLEEVQSALDSATQKAEVTLNAAEIGTGPDMTSLNPSIEVPITHVRQERDARVGESKGNQIITPAADFTLMRKWLQSNFKPSFFDVEQRQTFRNRIDSLGGQRRRVQYNSSRLLLKRRLRNHLKAKSRKLSAAQTSQGIAGPVSSLHSDDDDNDSIDIVLANPQDDSQDDSNISLPGRRRRLLGHSNRRRSESDLRGIDREEKRADLRSKIHSIEDKLERIRLNLSSSFSSLVSLEESSGDDVIRGTSADNTAVGESRRPARGLSSRSFSEGMISSESPPKEKKGLTGRLERIRGEKKMNLEKLQHALDSAMEAISAEVGP